jgi:hypothetical protein
MGSLTAQNIILVGGLVVQIVTLYYLIKYVRATKGIQEASNKQTELSQGLLGAADAQMEVSRDLMAAANAQAAASEKMARWQPEQWRRDSRGQDWKELVGALTECVLQIENAPLAPNVFATGVVAGRSTMIRGALMDAARALNDRLFITDALEKEHIRVGWREIEAMANTLPIYIPTPQEVNARSPSITDFQQKWEAFHRMLVSAAQADLGIAITQIKEIPTG